MRRPPVLSAIAWGQPMSAVYPPEYQQSPPRPPPLPPRRRRSAGSTPAAVRSSRRIARPVIGGIVAIAMEFGIKDIEVVR
jgi:hypothetical protein